MKSMLDTWTRGEIEARLQLERFIRELPTAGRTIGEGPPGFFQAIWKISGVHGKLTCVAGIEPNGKYFCVTLFPVGTSRFEGEEEFVRSHLKSVLCEIEE